MTPPQGQRTATIRFLDPSARELVKQLRATSDPSLVELPSPTHHFGKMAECHPLSDKTVEFPTFPHTAVRVFLSHGPLPQVATNDPTHSCLRWRVPGPAC